MRARAAVTLAALALLVPARLSPDSVITLFIRPQVSTAPATLEVRVRVHPVPEDRWMTVQMDSGEFYRESTQAVTDDRPLYSWRWRDIPPGEYQAVAAIGAGDKARARDMVRVLVQ